MEQGSSTAWLGCAQFLSTAAAEHESRPIARCAFWITDFLEPLLRACCCSVPTCRHFKWMEGFRAFTALDWSLLSCPLGIHDCSSGPKKGNCFVCSLCTTPCDLGYLQVFEMSECLQVVFDLLQHLEISAKSLGQLRNWPQYPCDVFSMLLQLAITSMMKENLWIKQVKVWTCRTHVLLV